uniref:Calpain catalytic domain-containing protein n=1 Tax=Timema shepardi TaxID=629360 RepID=A0A7R9B0R2_TIMSH|nr:unnamed protein product [Timema shepardi]
MTHSKRGGKKKEKATDAEYTLFPPPAITPTCHTLNTPDHASSLPSNPRQFLSIAIQWEHLTWDFAEILKQDSSKDEDMQPPPSNTHELKNPLLHLRKYATYPYPELVFSKEKLSMVRLIDARGEERKPFRPSSAVDERNTSVSNSNLNQVLSTNPDWTKMNDAQRERIGLTFDEEGEFWMPLEDFVSLFTELTLCRLLNINMFSLSQSWSEAVVRGAWSTGVHGSSEDRSGGCSSAFSGTFLRNPQARVSIRYGQFELAPVSWKSEGVGIPTLSYSSTPTRPIGSLLRASVVLTLVPI